MTYSDFKFPDVQRQLGIQARTADLYSRIEPVTVRPEFQSVILRGTRAALMNQTEKARSEFLIAPVLMELSSLIATPFGIYSGYDFNVNRDRGLVGFCDYMLSRTWNLMELTAPVIAIVEAKNDYIPNGMGQCIAEMEAASEFNATYKIPSQVIRGIVTTGTVWKFLSLKDKLLDIDEGEYPITDLPRLMGILKHVVESALGE